METRTKTLQERHEAIKTEKEGLVLDKKFFYQTNSGYHYLCQQGNLCESGRCPLYGSTCQGCDREHGRHCQAKICEGTCFEEGVAETGYSYLGYCLNDRCPNMPYKLVRKDKKDLMSFDVDDLIDKIKPTNRMDFDTHYIPVIEPYGKLAPGEIVRNPQAWVSLERCGNIGMVPANQLPLVTQDVLNALEVDGSKVVFNPFGKSNEEDMLPENWDLRKYLGLQADTDIMLNFRCKDMLLAHYWERYLYDRKNKVSYPLFEQLKDLGIDYCVSVNFSVYDSMPLYHNYYNLLRTLLSFVELQKYFGKNIVLELNTNPYSRQVDDTLMKIVREGKIKTVHHNFQLSQTGELEWATLRHDLSRNLEADEIILGGVGSDKQIIKYSRIMKNQRIYLSSTRAYLGTVIRQHASGRRWNADWPGDSKTKELERAFYYRNLFYANVDHYNETYEKIL